MRRTIHARGRRDAAWCPLLKRQQEKASMKLVTTSLAVGALVIALAGAAVAQTSLDPGAQGGAKAGAGTKTQTDRAKTGAGGSATTGAGAHTQGGSAGAAGSVSGQGSASGSAGGSMGATPGATGKPRGTGTLG